MSKITSRQILNFIKSYYKAKARLPTQNDLDDNGITREIVRQRFGSKSKADRAAKEEIASQLLEPPKSNVRQKINKQQKRYVIIGVQNNTKINKEFIDCLKKYVDDNGAELLALPMYYKNPTTRLENNKLDDEYWWDDAFDGKFVTCNMQLGKYLKLMPEHRIPVTNINPLSGLEQVSGNYSAIYANPQFAMRVIPESQDKIPHILHTTGTACVDNFSSTNAGGKAAAVAKTGALVVELSGDIYHIRQLEYRDKCIYDLDKRYKAGHKTKTLPSLNETSALVWGDIHAEVLDKSVLDSTLSLINKCNVTSHYLHDLIDFACQSHHNRNNFLMRYALNKYGHDSVTDAVSKCARFIQRLFAANADSYVYVVDSNHHDHLTRWINESDFKSMTADNALLYVTVLKRLLETIDLESASLKLIGDSAFKIALESVSKEMENRIDVHRLIFLDRNESYKYKDIELSQHGDIGPNGSRGSIKSFSKTNSKMVIGHSHTPGIHRNVYQVGKSSAAGQDYLKGYSSHLNTHCIIYPNGARALINIIGGRYTIEN